MGSWGKGDIVDPWTWSVDFNRIKETSSKIGQGRMTYPIKRDSIPNAKV